MKSRIIQIIAEAANVSSAHVTAQARLEEDLMLDSLELMQVQMLLEDELEAKLDDEKFTSCQTVQDVIDLVGQELAIH